MILSPEAIQAIEDKYGKPVRDSETGMALNIPLGLQMIGWQDQPGYQEFVKRREAAGFTVDDNDVNL